MNGFKHASAPLAITVRSPSAAESINIKIVYACPTGKPPQTFDSNINSLFNNPKSHFIH